MRSRDKGKAPVTFRQRAGSRMLWPGAWQDRRSSARLAATHRARRRNRQHANRLDSRCSTLSPAHAVLNWQLTVTSAIGATAVPGLSVQLERCRICAGSKLALSTATAKMLRTMADRRLQQSRAAAFPPRRRGNPANARGAHTLRLCRNRGDPRAGRLIQFESYRT